MRGALRVRLSERVGAVRLVPLPAAEKPALVDITIPVRPGDAVKFCSGCRARFTQATWDALPCLGVAHGFDWRNCTRCGTSLVVRAQWCMEDPAEYDRHGHYDLSDARVPR